MCQMRPLCALKGQSDLVYLSSVSYTHLNSALLREVCAKIRRMICQEEMPKDLADAIRHAYEELGKKVNEENPFVAVRSSATAEDLPDASLPLIHI